MMNPAEFANIAAVERDLWWYRGMKQILFRMLDPIANANRIEDVLEAGCGTGHLSATLAERYGWNMTPLDFDRNGLAYAQQSGLSKCVQGSITDLPFQDRAFDALLSIDVIPHLDRGAEHGVFAEFARVLKPGGLLVIRSAAFDFLRSRHSQFVNEIQRFTKPQLHEAAQKAGFTVERATYANSLLLPIAAFKFRVWEPLTRQAPASGVGLVPGWLDSLLYAPLRMEASWIGAGRSLPVGQTVIVIARRR
jgi:ubiquinone/menaquinone biosynthesis C-methylase UbiE